MDAPTLTELQGFTLSSYIRLLEFLKQHYKIVPFQEVDYQDTPYLILRHDIDFSLHEALKMASAEKNLGIKSTYFVLFSSILYNIFEGQNVSYLRQISNLGHEIGLHYHPAQYELYHQDFQQTLSQQIKLLESITGKKIHSISRHGLWVRDPFSRMKQYRNANDPYFRGDLFVHESCRAWATLEGLSLLLQRHPQRVQLLIHPENWQSDILPREELLERQFGKLHAEIEEIKKSLMDHYQKDSLVVKYERDIKQADFDRPIYSKTSKSRTNYSLISLMRYYLINSRVGWNIHALKERIENV